MVLEETTMDAESSVAFPTNTCRTPEKFQCSECKRYFTKLGLIYHKKTCTEKPDCKCVVCRWSSPTSNKYSMLNVVLSDVGRNLIKSMQFQDQIMEQAASGDSSLVDKNDKSNDICNESQTVAEAESSDNSINESDNFQIIAGIGGYVDDHGGVQCTRKLFCNTCSQHVHWELFGVHVIQHCSKLAKEHIQCPECPKIFSRPTMLLMHYFIHVSTHPLRCTDCSCQYQKCINTVAGKATTEHCYAETLHCYICFKVFSHGQAIANHMRLHSKEMPYACKVCNRSFRQIGNLQRHMATHRGDRNFHCPDCSRSFADPATLRNHMRVHTGETPFRCPICNRGFTQVGNMKRHCAVHVQEIPEKEKSNEESSASDKMEMKTGSKSADSDDSKDENFLQESKCDPPNAADNLSEETIFQNTKRRKKTGNGFKIFRCPTCCKIYTWKHDLQVHIRTHTGEKPFNCPFCDKRFAQSGAVRTHVARHHGGKTKSRKRPVPE